MILTEGLSRPHSGLVANYQTFNVLKAHYKWWHRLWVGGMNFEKFGPEWSLPSSHSSDKENKWCLCKTRIKTIFIKVKDIGHIGIKLSISSGIATMGIREREIKWSRHVVIWSRNYEYNVLSRKDICSYYRSLGSEFRYTLGKVLGT